jgi:hypothetical protein
MVWIVDKPVSVFNVVSNLPSLGSENGAVEK